MRKESPALPVSKYKFFTRGSLAVLGLILVLAAYAQSALFSVKIKDSNGWDFSMRALKDNRASVIIFLSPECPLCQSYSLNIRQLQQEFSRYHIGFYGIIPDSSFSNAEVNAYRKKYQLLLPLLRDNTHAITSLLKATVTPEAFVLDEEGKILYSGRIDNWAYDLGKKRKLVTRHELKDALTAISKNQPVKISKTKAVGCFIE